jgi:hypothetical protein
MFCFDELQEWCDRDDYIGAPQRQNTLSKVLINLSKCRKKRGMSSGNGGFSLRKRHRLHFKTKQAHILIF